MLKLTILLQCININGKSWRKLFSEWMHVGWRTVIISNINNIYTVLQSFEYQWMYAILQRNYCIINYKTWYEISINRPEKLCLQDYQLAIATYSLIIHIELYYIMHDRYCCIVIYNLFELTFALSYFLFQCIVSHILHVRCSVIRFHIYRFVR